MAGRALVRHFGGLAATQFRLHCLSPRHLFRQQTQVRDVSGELHFKCAVKLRFEIKISLQRAHSRAQLAGTPRTRDVDL
jgi:hypothetical protein